MSVVSAPLKNGIALQKDIFRLAAMLYSATNDTYSTDDAQLQMVKCVFADENNRYMGIYEIITGLLDVYRWHITEDEVEAIIRRSKKTFLRAKLDGQDVYKLTDEAYSETVESQEKSIDYYIDLFIDTFDIAEKEQCKEAIHKYLYELTTTNINSYYVLYTGKNGFSFSDKELSVEVDDFNGDEIEWIHNFLSWQNNEKNIALGNIVYCCLEYCLLVYGDSPNRFLKGVVRKRLVYLDTNIIFRALGINGESRKKVIEAFLQKCRQAKIKLVISSHTKNEFTDTITHYVSQIAAYPRGDVYEGAFEQLTDYTIFSFYDDWRKTHKGLSLTYFRHYIMALYQAFITSFGIVDNERIPKEIYDSDTFKETRNHYSTDIRKTKQELRPYYAGEDYYYDYSKKDSHDATIVHYAELQREDNYTDSDVFVVSSDKSLRFWDMSRSDTRFPVVVYPSQLFLVLIKLCGRSANDFDSFVNFINIRTNTHQMTPDQANIILSGISSITEDILKQEHLVSSICGDHFQDIIQHSASDSELYERIQAESKRYLEQELEHSNERIKNLEESFAQQEDTVANLSEKLTVSDNQQKETQRALNSAEEKLEKQNRHIYELAERETRSRFIWKNIGVPVLLVIATIAFAAFIALQFFFGDRPWNFVVLFFDWVATTPFGSKVGDFVYVIDGVFVYILGFALKNFMRNPFNKRKMEESRLQMIQAYIANNMLD